MRQEAPPQERLPNWPIYVALLCVAYDTKWVVPTVVWLGLSVTLQYAIPMATAVIELLYWNWFIGFFPRWTKQQKEAREEFLRFWNDGFGKRIKKLWPPMQNLALWVWDWGVRRWDNEFNSDGKFKKWLGRFVIWFFKTMPKMFAYPLIVFLGIMPGGFLLAVPLCRTHKIPLALGTLLATSAATNWALVHFGADWLAAHTPSVQFFSYTVLAIVLLVFGFIAYAKLKHRWREHRAK